MRGFWRGVVLVIAIGIVVAIGAFVYTYYGFYNVAANPAGTGRLAWFMGSVSDHSVARHAAVIQVPAVADPAMARAGFQHYRTNCVACHAAPGVPAGDLVKGLDPSPPKLQESADELTPQEIFWIVKYGVKMTGMPAWRTSRTDQQLWDIVAFVRRLPDMTDEEYRTLDGQAPPPSRK